MQYVRTGLILCTENYAECVGFYSLILELPILYVLDNEHSKLTCCDMGGNNYLMIETEGSASASAKSLEQSPVCLRFNVDNIEQAVAELQSKGVKVKPRKEVWGTVADFVDPDGNRCSLHDETTF